MQVADKKPGLEVSREPALTPEIAIEPSVAMGEGQRSVVSMLDGGAADPQAIAGVIKSHPIEREAILAAIQSHANGGNALAGQVIEALTPRPPVSHPTLRMGSRGQPVVDLQSALVRHGAEISADGAFGPMTLAAVKTFQRQRGLAADGIVGKLTWTALDNSPTQPEDKITQTPPKSGGGGGGGGGAGKTAEDKPGDGKEEKTEGKDKPGPTGPVDNPGSAEFSAAYGSAKSHLGLSFDDYKNQLGPMKAASEQVTPGKAKPHKFTSPLTVDDLCEIFPALRTDMNADPDVIPKVEQFVNEMNTAFRIMKFDTIEAQAAFLGNAYVESDQFRRMTETQRYTQRYEADPNKVKMDENWLNRAASGQIAGCGAYRQGGHINPNGDWHDSFVGRGATQVTFRYYYVQVIAVMEKMAEELEAQGDPQSLEDAARIRRSANAIKQDPSQAANPEHTFLFTTAYWKMPDNAGNTGESKANAGNKYGHMGSYQPERQKKDAAYDRAVAVMMRKLQQEQQEDDAQA